MTMSTRDAENREVVRTALEQVCARGDMALSPSCYAEDFVDHVGRLEYRGLEGARPLCTARYWTTSPSMSSTRSPKAIV